MDKSSQRLRARVQKQREKPLARLTEHFFTRFFEVSAVTRDTDSRLGIAPVLGLLAVPGTIMSLILFMKYSSLARWFTRSFEFDRDLAVIPDKYTFITFSMAATGIVSVLKWDSLFPDRRDFENLAPLPISTRIVFLAKLAALITFAIVFAVDLNLFSSVLFPMIAMENEGSPGEILRFIAAHTAGVVAASTFAFSAFLAAAGVLMNMLPYAAFRKTTRYLQFLAITLLLVMFLLTPLTTPGLLSVRGGGDSFHTLLPPVWFLGLSEALHGKATPAFVELGGRAIWTSIALAALAAISYVFAYRRYFLKTAETPEIVGAVRRLPDWFWRTFDATILRAPFERGAFRFALKTLFRSDRHNSVLAAFLGVGAALAVQASVMPARDPGRLGITSFTLAASLTLVYFMLTGLRFSFGLSHEERANWTFQTAVTDSAPNAQSVARKIMIVFLAAALLVTIPVYTMLAGIGVALTLVAYTALQSILLIELLVMDFRNIPFTCTHVPGKDNLVFAVSIFFTVYLVFAHASAIFGYALLRDPNLAPIFLIINIAGIFAVYRAGERDAAIQYEQPSGSLQLLRLSE
jgi:hypothetical protein